MVFVFSLFPDPTGWCVRLEGAQVAHLPTFAAAERRARWLTTKQAVRGYRSELHVLDEDQTLVGRWIGERYQDSAPPAPVLVAA
jgi:hypothetical protein